MQRSDYHQIMDWLRPNVPAAEGHELAWSAERFQAALEQSGLFHSIEVETTEDPEQLVVAMAGYDPSRVSAEMLLAVEDLWSQHLQHAFWGRSTTTFSPSDVELRGVTRWGEHGAFVTLRLLVQAAPVPVAEPIAAPAIPAQRSRRSWFPKQRRALAGS